MEDLDPGKSLSSRVSVFPFVMVITATFVTGAFFVVLNAPLILSVAEGKALTGLGSLFRTVGSTVQSALQSAKGLVSFSLFLFISLIVGFLITPLDRIVTILATGGATLLARLFGREVPTTFFSPVSMRTRDYAAFLAWLIKNPPEKVNWEWHLFHYRIYWGLFTNVLTFSGLSLYLLRGAITFSLVFIFGLLSLASLVFGLSYSILMARVHEHHMAAFSGQSREQTQNSAKEAAIATLERCGTLLSQYQHMLKRTLRQTGQEEYSPVVMLLRAFDFGIETIEAMKDLLNKGHKALYACTLCRPFHEISVRILWASRAEYGWPRLENYYADEDRKWAKKAREREELAAPAETILARAQQILSRPDENGKPIKPAPNIEQTLLEIERCDVDGKLTNQELDFGRFQYTFVYRILCRPAHGHIMAIGDNTLVDYMGFVGEGAIGAVWSLLQAFCHLSSDKDAPKQFDAINARICQIMRLSQGSSNGVEQNRQH